MVNWDNEGHHQKLEPFDETKYEYTTTTGPRKGEVPEPEGDSWEEIDWVRDDYTDTGLWRRLKKEE